MKSLRLFSLLVAGASLAAPLSAFAKDKGDKKKHDRHDRHERSDRNHRGHDSRHYSSSNHRHGYSRSYHSGYYGSSYYGSPYYYSRPGIGLSIHQYSTPASVYRGRSAYDAHSSLAVDVQRELRRRGYYRGTIDGDIGPGSRSAIRRYQAERGLVVTGRIDSSLVRALGIS